MPPARRRRLASRRASKRPRRADSSSHGGAEDDGTPLTDEILVGIFAGLPEMADLVRCAATCTRWRRLVSSEAAFICRTPRPWPAGRFVRRLALGFFHRDAAAGPRFTPTASAARSRLPGLLQPNVLVERLNALVERPENGPRLVASRNGLIVADLRRGRRDRAIKLCVCNPMTGEVDVLPPLSGEDGLGRYACTVLTADDHDQTSDPPPPAYRVILFYNTCRSNTAFRSYSSEDGVWSPETIRGERLGKKQMGVGVTRTSVVVYGGKVACWFAKNAVLALSLNTLLPQVLSRAFVDGNTILGVSPPPGRRLCTIQMIFEAPTGYWPRRVALRVSKLNRSIHQGQEEDEVEVIQVEQHLPADVTTGQLRWFCEKSGVVLFTAGCSHGRSEVYALSLDKKEVEKIASHEAGGGGGGDPWENLHGYEMDRVAYLATLGVGYRTGG
ncbi:uncharacterized protein LOC123408135 [Hordeum vulgare subsp. vulgare]|uniref:F-box domain-containing protein n=1 Tax=Hordeum vulgare subsp. vulgare TaxID=112509 RepID=A0A8I6YZI7_HORVV|nr:uncharacterized protein LOC123408135 [Hordeum vulgare subsp. vulgare]